MRTAVNEKSRLNFWEGFRRKMRAALLEDPKIWTTFLVEGCPHFLEWCSGSPKYGCPHLSTENPPPGWESKIGGGEEKVNLFQRVGTCGKCNRTSIQHILLVVFLTIKPTVLRLLRRKCALAVLWVELV
jgi:hypothetical protein